MGLQILALDDEPIALDEIKKSIMEAVTDCVIKCYDEPEDALEEIIEKGFMPDIAFLDIEMPRITGIEMAKRIHESCKNTKIVFVTGFSQYAIEAYNIHARGYLMKPPTAEKVKAEIENAFENIPKKSSKKIRVRCFGNFEVFADNVPVKFSRSKTKELFAYLIDRKGAAITTDELLNILWEDMAVTDSLRSQLRNSIADLSNVLKKLGEDQVLLKINRNSYAINTEMVDCDYYQYLNHNINLYIGEYMLQYSWSEFTAGNLDNLFKP